MPYIGTQPKDVRSFGKAQFDFTATQGQTAFTGADDDGKTLGFTEGQIQVYVNGILMDASDYTTSNANTVTLVSAANLNDIITVVALQTDIPNSDYVPISGGTFTGDVGIGATTPITTLEVEGTATVGNSAGTSYNENLRLPRADNGYVSIGMATNPTSASGVLNDQWTQVVYPSDHATTASAFGIRYGSGSAATSDVIYARNNKSVAFPHMPFVYATRAALNEDISSSDGSTKLKFDDELHDQTNSWNTSTSRFTAPVGGIYEVIIQCWFKTGTYGTIYVELHKNGSVVREARLSRSSSIAEYTTFLPNLAVTLNENDYIELYGRAGLGNAELHTSNTSRYTRLTIEMKSTGWGG